MPAVSVSVNPGPALQPQAPGTLTVLVSNKSPLNLNLLAVLQCRPSLIRRGAREQLFCLPPGGTKELHLEFLVPSGGAHALRFYLEETNHHVEALGAFVLDVIPNSQTANLSIVYNSKYVVGDQHNELAAATSRSPLRTGEFTPISLEDSPGRYHPSAVPGSARTRLTLEWEEDGQRRAACILAQDKTTLGRGSECCIQLQDAEQISRKHLEIHLAPQGARWFSLSKNCVDMDGRSFGPHDQPPAGRQFRDGSALNLAGELLLTPKLFRAGDDWYQNQHHYQRFVHIMQGTFPEFLAPDQAVRLTRQNPRELYLLMQTVALLGSHEQATLSLAHLAVEPSHARLLHLAGHFWIQPYSGDSVVLLEGERLAPWELGLLRPGIPVFFGAENPLRLNVSEFWQPLTKK